MPNTSNNTNDTANTTTHALKIASMSSNSNSSSGFQLGNYNFNSEDDFQAWLNASIEQDRRLDDQSTTTTTTAAAAAPATNDDGNDSDDSSSSISTAPSVQHDPESEEGLLALHRIREAFFMAPSTPFAEVRAFFEGNANVVRHLARLTVPHPDHYLPDERTSRVHEPILQSDRALAAVRILFDVKAVDWQSEGMATLLDLVFREDREHLFYYTELLRKHRTGKRTKRAREWLRRHDRRFRELDNLQTARRRMERARGRRRSSLHNEMHYSSSSSDSSGGAPL